MQEKTFYLFFPEEYALKNESIAFNSSLIPRPPLYPLLVLAWRHLISPTFPRLLSDNSIFLIFLTKINVNPSKLFSNLHIFLADDLDYYLALYKGPMLPAMLKDRECRPLCGRMIPELRKVDRGPKLNTNRHQSLLSTGKEIKNIPTTCFQGFLRLPI